MGMFICVLCAYDMYNVYIMYIICVCRFLLTAGKDQVVYLWSVVGELVGRVGGTSWNILDPKTWGRGRSITCVLYMYDVYMYDVCILGKYVSPESKCQQLYNSKTLEFEKNAAALRSGILRGGHYDINGNFHELYISRYDKNGHIDPEHQKGLSQLLNNQVALTIRKNQQRRFKRSSAAQNELLNNLTSKHPFVEIPKETKPKDIEKMDSENNMQMYSYMNTKSKTKSYQMNSTDGNTINSPRTRVTNGTYNATWGNKKHGSVRGENNPMDLEKGTAVGNRLDQMLSSKQLEGTQALLASDYGNTGGLTVDIPAPQSHGTASTATVTSNRASIINKGALSVSFKGV